MALKLNIVIWCESIELKKAAVQAGLGVELFYPAARLQVKGHEIDDAFPAIRSL